MTTDTNTSRECPNYNGNWAVLDSESMYLTQGLQSPAICDDAIKTARDLANDFDEPVWLGPECDCEECPSAIEVKPGTWQVIAYTPSEGQWSAEVLGEAHEPRYHSQGAAKLVADRLNTDSDEYFPGKGMVYEVATA